ncbi:glycosyltransferase [Methylocapsa polymorpha]|uniref:Glycosyltransferase n=1 Tax=Methylocapsa polymorpha TaxID=3080828 RepID=A0ABZ0HP84_9HYPH|nr:glycosyltransferase [Methylocapsa sp. RX1]
MAHILYIGPWAGTAEQRIRAFQRLGHEVTVVDPDSADPSIKLLDFWKFHTGALGLSWLYKNYILSKVKGEIFDFVFVDHGELIGPAAVAALKKIGKIVVNYNQDNPYVARDGRRWRLFLEALPAYDLIVSPRLSSAQAAQRVGARRVLAVKFAADEAVHRPIELTEESRARFSSQVVFVGTWFPERGPFLLRLIERGVPLRIYGERWTKAPEYEALRSHVVLGNLEGEDYVKAIRGASIAIGLLSKGNEDLHTTRSLEIPAIGTLFCAERTSDHLAMYKDGEEAVFFDGPDECADLCLALLANPERIKQIAAAGFNRVRQNGDFNEKLLAKILDAAAKPSAASCPDAAQQTLPRPLVRAGD